MKISVCIGYTNRVYQNMARVAARSVKQHTPGATIRLVRCQNKGYRQNMGTRFEAYVDESADWVSAMDADSLCFGDIGAIVQRAEHEGWDFLGRLSGRPRKAPRTFDRRRYERLFRDAGRNRIAVHVPNAFLVRPDRPRAPQLRQMALQAPPHHGLRASPPLSLPLPAHRRRLEGTCRRALLLGRPRNGADWARRFRCVPHYQRGSHLHRPPERDRVALRRCGPGWTAITGSKARGSAGSRCI